MTCFRLAIRSLTFHWRTATAAAAGVAVAGTVIVGALVVGDSMRGSLRDNALSRLGAITHSVSVPVPFRSDLADRVAKAATIPESRVAPLLMMRGSVMSADGGSTAPNVSVLGVNNRFWGAYPTNARPSLYGRTVAISEALAADLSIKRGDSIILNIGKDSAVPPDTLFAKRSPEQTTASLRVVVGHILANRGPGGFRLDTSAAPARNVFVSLPWLADATGHENKANTLVFVSKANGSKTGDAYESASYPFALRRSLSLDDMGLKIRISPSSGYIALESNGVTLEDSVRRRVQLSRSLLYTTKSLVSVYLADSVTNLSGLKAGTSAYAVVAGLEDFRAFQLLAGSSNSPGGSGVWLNDWIAGDIGAKVGDSIRLNYLTPSPDGSYYDQSVSLTITGIVAMAGPAADRNLPPSYEGMTDSKHIGDWQTPFPVDLTRVTERDETYWDKYRATPKIFVELETARRMWHGVTPSSGVSGITAIHLTPKSPADMPRTASSLRNMLRRTLSPGEAGFALFPVRERALQAAEGTTDFASLFTSMSFFVICSGCALAWMLMRLSVEQRSAEFGVLAACGFRTRDTARIAYYEGIIVAALGTAVAVPLGLLYAHTMTYALNNWWAGAVGDIGVRLHLQPDSIFIGAAATLVVGCASTLLAARVLTLKPVLSLLRGWRGNDSTKNAKTGTVPRGLSPFSRSKLWLMLTAGLFVVSCAGALARKSDPTGVFFALGVAALALSLAALNHILASRSSGHALLSIWGLAVRNAASARSRSVLLAGLFAAACFTVVATSANKVDFLRGDSRAVPSGSGGFGLLATSSVPVNYDFGTKTGREKLGFPPEDEELFRRVYVVTLLATPGEDISCLNIARPSQPRLLGIDPKDIPDGRFNMVSPEASWSMLTRRGRASAYTAVADAASVQWSLHSGLGRTIRIRDGSSEPANLRFVALLSGSIFQSEIILSKASLRRLFPRSAQPRYFLIKTPPGRERAVAKSLRENLGRMGVQIRETREILNSFIGVQNTYLSMFLALGGLGVAIGTLGLAALIARSVLERRPELALMLAQGFRPSTISALLLAEHGGLMLYGALCGSAAAIVATAPQLAASNSGVNWPAVLLFLAGSMLLGIIVCAVSAAKAVGPSLMNALRGE